MTTTLKSSLFPQIARVGAIGVLACIGRGACVRVGACVLVRLQGAAAERCCPQISFAVWVYAGVTFKARSYLVK